MPATKPFRGKHVDLVKLTEPVQKYGHSLYPGMFVSRLQLAADIPVVETLAHQRVHRRSACAADKRKTRCRQLAFGTQIGLVVAAETALGQPVARPEIIRCFKSGLGWSSDGGRFSCEAVVTSLVPSLDVVVELGVQGVGPDVLVHIVFAGVVGIEHFLYAVTVESFFAVRFCFAGLGAAVHCDAT